MAKHHSFLYCKVNDLLIRSLPGLMGQHSRRKGGRQDHAPRNRNEGMVLARFNCYENTAVRHFKWLTCECSGLCLAWVNWINTFSRYPPLSTDCAGTYCRKICLNHRSKSNNKNKYWILPIKGNS